MPSELMTTKGGDTVLKTNWIRLDNAAKIFPAATRRSDTQVFRIICELWSPVRPEVLCTALEETLEDFPLFRNVMKRGMFWYYLESSDLKPVVAEECHPPCSAIYDKNRKTLLFDVSYYNCRINLEVFHVLTDGTGAMHFMSTLVTKYISQLESIEEPQRSYDASHAQMSDDSFLTYTSGKIKHRTATENACQLRGQRYTENRLKLIDGIVSAVKVRAAAKQYGTTVTAFLCTCMLNAINETLTVRARRKPVVISVPVNLRNVFPSESARNFFGVILVPYKYSDAGLTNFEDVLAAVSGAIKRGIDPQKLSRSIDAFTSMERNIIARISPLPLKNIVMRVAYLLSRRRKVTATLSNIGIIQMPAEMEPHIKAFRLFSGTDTLQACICSFGDCMSIGFSSPFINSDIQRRFFRKLREMEIDVELTTNTIDEE